MLRIASFLSGLPAPTIELMSRTVHVPGFQEDGGKASNPKPLCTDLFHQAPATLAGAIPGLPQFARQFVFLIPMKRLDGVFRKSPAKNSGRTFKSCRCFHRVKNSRQKPLKKPPQLLPAVFKKTREAASAFPSPGPVPPDKFTYNLPITLGITSPVTCL
jgi:hypothetical protein